ncbi:NarK/NasA family nitrate transporter [Staphylococcus sp. IVB6246]|uniref:nitrate/nitrite transporter n=1 Tax=Staphylococcus sp. IVB6246 TaxID=2989772 RepID=UPI0021D33F9C|nr:nitrate/nitrite transporter [Staphylococcus sp. IVB6246]UXR69388.1 NarK/NasA family nitrate transporter [Staphylococcus sp. IVB6246]
MDKSKAGLQLGLQTLSLVAGFMAWTIIAPLMPFISQDIEITSGQLSIILAIPVILGSVLRVPFGYLTNIVGAKWVFFTSFVVLLVPIFLLSQASTPGNLMFAGFFLGVGGAIFSVGVTSIPKYFAKDKVGLANGIYGMGNLGTAVSAFLAPPIAGIIGWQNTVMSYLAVMVVFALIMFFLGDGNEPKVKVPLVEQSRILLKNYKLYYLSFWYFITFGAFVAFGLFLPNFLVEHFGVDKVDAGIRTGVFIAIATLLRPIGGMLGDKFDAVTMLKAFFTIMIVSALIIGLSDGIFLFTVGCLTVSVCAGIGNGLIFKLVPHYFSKEAGVANGIVSMMGGLGGFFPPLVISAVSSMTGSSNLAFILLAIFGVVALLTMFNLSKREKTAGVQ